MEIKSLELEPTKDNILKTITRNLIDRNHSVWQFARFCDAQEGRCSTALDAQWGYGKTFFVKQAKMLLESFNAFTNTLTDEEKAQIKGAFSQYIGSGDNAIDLQPQVCVYYDAWSNDNDIDPVLSLFYEIVRNTACDYSFKKGRDCVKIATSMQIDGCTVHTYNDGELIACFDENISDSVIKSIAKRQPLRAVFRDSSFAGSPAKINVGEIFKMLAPDTRVKVI